MASLDVEALLEATEKQANDQHQAKHAGHRSADSRDGARHSDSYRDDAHRSDTGSNSSRGRGRRDSHDHRRGPSRRHRRDGDFYRGGRVRSRTRSRSPRRRPRDDRDRRRDRRSMDQGRPSDRTPTRNEDERDRHTVFVQQLANRLRTEQLKKFFEEHVGPVNEAQIVKDRISGRSKGSDSEHSSSSPYHSANTLPVLATLSSRTKSRSRRLSSSPADLSRGFPSLLESLRRRRTGKSARRRSLATRAALLPSIASTLATFTST